MPCHTVCFTSIFEHSVADSVADSRFETHHHGVPVVVSRQQQGVKEPVSVFYEPHCDFDAASVAQQAPVDVVISPVQSLILGG